jgi:CRP/FNR family cyclic AMP-dependent transcriptional regulator
MKNLNHSEIQTDIEYLRKTAISDFLNNSDLEVLFKHNSKVNFNTNEIILHQGKIAVGIYLILQGEVSIQAQIMGEGNTKIGVLKEGAFLGEISFIERGPSTTSAVAASGVSCLWIPHTFFDLLSNYYPSIKYKLLQSLNVQICSRLKQTHDKVVAEIAENKIKNQSFFAKVIHSITQPKPIQVGNIENYAFVREKFFPHLSNQEREILFNHVTFLGAPKNCVLIQEGQKKASCFVVVQGAVQSSIMNSNKIAKLSVIGPGSLFAGIACIDNASEFTITFTTCERAILLHIDENKLVYFQKNYYALWYKLFDLITSSLVALRKSIDKLDVRLHIEKYNR